jgi:hypothetical protein
MGTKCIKTPGGQRSAGSPPYVGAWTLCTLILLRALAADLRQEPNMGNLYVRIRAGGAERSASLPRP